MKTPEEKEEEEEESRGLYVNKGEVLLDMHTQTSSCAGVVSISNLIGF